MSENRKLAAILAADVVGFSRLAATDEERTVARLRGLRTDLIDPAISVHHGRVVKRTGDGILIEFRSVVDAVRCAIEVQNGMVERNAGLPPERQILFRAGVHLGDVIEEADGDLMGDGVNIAARLESICEPGAICLSEHAYLQVKSRLDLAVADLGDKDLKNIPEPVHVYSLEVGKPVQAKPVVTVAAVVTPPLRKERSFLLPIFGGIAALLVIIAAGAWYLLVRPGANLAANAPAHLSIVVLPFANLSNDPKQDYFADGITENLTTDLSRIRNSFVIARNTAFTYKGKNVDAKEIGKELGVRYVLEGSVQRDGNRVRVNAQLIDAESGAHLWADRFEEDLADLFKLQDDVVARLANTLGYELVKAEAEKGAHSANPDAIDLTMQGWALLQQPPTKEVKLTAQRAFEQALRIDPNNANALAGEAQTYYLDFVYWNDSKTDYDDKILVPANRAIAVAPAAMWAYYAKSFYLCLTHRAAEGLEVADAGLAMNPNLAPLYLARDCAELSLGRLEQGRADIEHAIRLSPLDPDLINGRWHLYLGNIELAMSHYDQSIDEELKAIRAGFHTFVAYMHLAAAYALAGKMDEAKSALSEARRLNPQLTVKWAMAHGPNEPVMFDGLRKTGLPEDAAPPPPKHLSIVVLPFTNLSGDPKQDYFADGITENLTTDLSRIRNSFVIARNTAFTYKGKNIDAKEIGKELGVRYVLEGSVQRDGSRVRVNAQLIDAESGAHLWADRFEEDLADLFKLQDDVVARLANTLGYELVKAEAEKGSHSTNPDAIDLAMQGWAILNQPAANYTKDLAAHALMMFERALNQDPKNVDALVGAALAERYDYSFGSDEAKKAEEKARIEDRLETAIKIDPNNARAFVVRGFFFQVTRRSQDAEAAAQKAITLDPSYAAAYAQLAQAQSSPAEFEQSISNIDHAMKLSPRDPDMGRWHWIKGKTFNFSRQFQEAIREERAAIDGGFSNYASYLHLAVAYAWTGQQAEAEAAIAQARRMNPRLTMRWARAIVQDPEVIYEGLRKAGLPEDEPPPKHLSIVVLPFTNLSGDPKQDYFADGITENLTTDLSRIRNSFVIARNTAFTYKGKNLDAKDIGKELGVRYVLEGSVQRDGNRVRVNAQLIDAESGSHLWANRFEEDLVDLFKLQDDVVARLANALGYELVKAEAARSAHSTNPDVIDLDMRGQALLFQSPNKEGNLTARDFFEAALKIDPNNDDALAGEARTYEREFVYGWGTSASSTDYDAKVLPLLDRAIGINPGNLWAYVNKTYYLFLSNRAEQAVAAANAGLAVNPNFAPLYIARRGAELTLGRFDEALADVRQAIRLSPRDTELPQWHFQLGAVQLALGHYDAAVDEEMSSINSGYRAFQPYTYLAAAYALTNKIDDAKANLAEAVRINPKLTIKWAETHSPNQIRYFEGLRKAGLPEDEGPRLSIVVLPFQNLSGDTKQDYLADVLTDELTTYISRIPGSFVIARNTAFTYKGKPTDVKTIGKDLGVRYALEGSVQPTDKRIRTNAQLIDTETGAHLWAEEFDTDKTDLLQTEDDIVTRLARTLQIQLSEIEAARLEHSNPGIPDAQELALRCFVIVQKSDFLDKEAGLGYRLCEKALDLDPKNVIALTILAHQAASRVVTFQSANKKADIERVEEFTSRALVIEPNNPYALLSRARTLMIASRLAEASIATERALALSPSLIDAYVVQDIISLYRFEPERTIESALKAMRLSPRDPQLYVFQGHIGTANFWLHRDDQAITWLRQSIALYRSTQPTYLYLIAALALNGHENESRNALSDYFSLNPRAKTVAVIKAATLSTDPRYFVMRERLFAGLRLAGMPEQ